MGWTNSHLFQFQDNAEWMEPANLTVAIPNPYDMDDMWNQGEHREADKVTLKNVFFEERKGEPFWYWYDFGDSWWHKLTFQEPTKKELENFKGRPVCTEASGACPPEDSGGPFGYSDFLEIITDKKHPEYREMREWAGIGRGKKYDPDFADLETINANLAVLPHRREWKLTAENYFDG